MPPTRRRTGNTSAANQSTLSFGSSARVTKPTAPTPTSQKAKALEPAASVVPEEHKPEKPQPSNDVAEPQQIPVTPAEPSKPHTAELAVRGQAKVETKETPWGEEDKKALNVSEKDLVRYWKSEEEGRRAPRVHQEDLGLHEKILRHFDLSSQYGPCIGIARIKRWRRANMLNLNPPLEVLAVLLKHEDDVKQRAYMDELMS
ncbi:hypothetical protein SI65_05183 [Aspergillus cristatus]|uniref:DNA polymerase delta subunit 4 n=1 Tax=Aspergillus cristatus TaxID=573508 RepID=A0A1E3BGT7_ASPCR|nr:hypothetical protein SI65_05183 [Aspergillus cristatus]